MALEVSQLTFISEKHSLLITGVILFLWENNRDIKKPTSITNLSVKPPMKSFI